MTLVYDRINHKRLVFVDGFGVMLNKFFCDRYGITEGASVYQSVIDRHTKEVPPEIR